MRQRPLKPDITIAPWRWGILLLAACSALIRVDRPCAVMCQHRLLPPVGLLSESCSEVGRAKPCIPLGGDCRSSVSTANCVPTIELVTGYAMKNYSKHVFAILAASLGLSSALAKDVCSNESTASDKSAGASCRAALPGRECLKAGREFSLGAVVQQGDRYYRCVQARPWSLEADIQSVWIELETGSTAAVVRQSGH